MKNLQLTLTAAILLICSVQKSNAWGRLGHATIACIAERHLTDKAKAALDIYLDGRSIVYYASWLDDYKPQMLVDVGYDPVNYTRVVRLPHTFSVDSEGEVVRGNRWPDGKYLINCIHYIEESADMLKNRIADLDDSTRLARIQLIVHCLGDMHCPAHIRYPDNTGIGYYNVEFFGAVKRYHNIWDTDILVRPHPWSFSDLAWLLDRYSLEERAAVTAGDIYDWGRDSAARSHCIYEVREGDSIGQDFINRYKPLAESQVTRAGYRLAKVLNYIFI